MSWPMMLLRPSHRLGASSAQRTSHDDRNARAPRFGSPSATSLTIVREPLRDESRAFFGVRCPGERRGGVFDHPPLAALTEVAEPADHVRRDAIDQRELVAATKRARVAARNQT